MPHVIADLTPAEIDSFVMDCRRALNSHVRVVSAGDIEQVEDAHAAIETIVGCLRELLSTAPETKRAKIEALLNCHSPRG